LDKVYACTIADLVNKQLLRYAKTKPKQSIEKKEFRADTDAASLFNQFGAQVLLASSPIVDSSCQVVVVAFCIGLPG
jgi:hypothetical protein